MLIVGAVVIAPIQLICETPQHFSQIFYLFSHILCDGGCLVNALFARNAPRYLAPSDVVELRTNLSSFSTRHVYEW